MRCPERLTRCEQKTRPVDQRIRKRGNVRRRPKADMARATGNRFIGFGAQERTRYLLTRRALGGRMRGLGFVQRRCLLKRCEFALHLKVLGIGIGQRDFTRPQFTLGACGLRPSTRNARVLIGRDEIGLILTAQRGIARDLRPRCEGRCLSALCIQIDRSEIAIQTRRARVIETSATANKECECEREPPHCVPASVR
jgi:hypothetical protein